MVIQLREMNVHAKLWDLMADPKMLLAHLKQSIKQLKSYFNHTFTHKIEQNMPSLSIVTLKERVHRIN
jgi:hypothetical protein